jgi:hypothetical protein
VDLVVDHLQQIVGEIILDKVQEHNLDNQENLDHMDLVIQVVVLEMAMDPIKLLQVAVVQVVQDNEDSQPAVVQVEQEDHTAFLVLQ